MSTARRSASGSRSAMSRLAGSPSAPSPRSPRSTRTTERREGATGPARSPKARRRRRSSAPSKRPRPSDVVRASVEDSAEPATENTAPRMSVVDPAASPPAGARHPVRGAGSPARLRRGVDERRRHVEHRLPDVPRAGREVRRRPERHRRLRQEPQHDAPPQVRRAPHRGSRDEKIIEARATAGRSRSPRCSRSSTSSSSSSGGAQGRPRPHRQPCRRQHAHPAQVVPRGRRRLAAGRSATCSLEVLSERHERYMRDLESSTPAMAGIIDVRAGRSKPSTRIEQPRRCSVAPSVRFGTARRNRTCPSTCATRCAASNLARELAEQMGADPDDAELIENQVLGGGRRRLKERWARTTAPTLAHVARTARETRDDRPGAAARPRGQGTRASPRPRKARGTDRSPRSGASTRSVPENAPSRTGANRHGGFPLAAVRARPPCDAGPNRRPTASPDALMGLRAPVGNQSHAPAGEGPFSWRRAPAPGYPGAVFRVGPVWETEQPAIRNRKCRTETEHAARSVSVRQVDLRRGAGSADEPLDRPEQLVVGRVRVDAGRHHRLVARELLRGAGGPSTAGRHRLQAWWRSV